MLCNRPITLTLASSRFSLRRQVARPRSRALYCTNVPNFSQLHAALKWEEDRGFINSEGRSGDFVSFIRRKVSDLETPPKLEHLERIVSTGITHYDSLDVPNRKTLLLICRAFFDELQSPQSSNGDQVSEREIFGLGPWSKIESIERSIMRQIHKGIFNQTAGRMYMDEDSVEEDPNDLQQGSNKWLEFRKGRLTASTFSKVLGMFNRGSLSDAHELWLEKLDQIEPFKGNEMTRWGSKKEKTALEHYCKSTGNKTEHRGAGVLGEHLSEKWIAGSPDGLIQIQNPSRFEVLSADVREVLVPPSSLGLLEIKCPFGGRRGPKHAQPPDQLAAYYMPQIQGLMEIFDRDWCHLYYWTMSHGAKLFLVYRDQQYWNALYEILAQFWWEHVIPAKLYIEQHGAIGENYQKYKPELETSELLQESERLAKQAPQLLLGNTGQVIL